jgi:hypothetical protein
MSCPYEQSTVAYARFSAEAMELILDLYKEYEQMAAKNAVVPSPHLEPVISSFIDLWRVTVAAHPIRVE